MPLNPPLCLEVTFTNVLPTGPTTYSVTFTTAGQGYDGGNQTYDGNTITTGMYCANNSYGYIFLITSIVSSSQYSTSAII